MTSILFLLQFTITIFISQATETGLATNPSSAYFIATHKFELNKNWMTPSPRVVLMPLERTQFKPAAKFCGKMKYQQLAQNT